MPFVFYPCPITVIMALTERRRHTLNASYFDLNFEVIATNAWANMRVPIFHRSFYTKIDTILFHSFCQHWISDCMQNRRKIVKTLTKNQISSLLSRKSTGSRRIHAAITCVNYAMYAIKLKMMLICTATMHAKRVKDEQFALHYTCFH